jgi:hypothetical protein
MVGVSSLQVKNENAAPRPSGFSASALVAELKASGVSVGLRSQEILALLQRGATRTQVSGSLPGNPDLVLMALNRNLPDGEHLA